MRICIWSLDRKILVASTFKHDHQVGVADDPLLRTRHLHSVDGRGHLFPNGGGVAVGVLVLVST